MDFVYASYMKDMDFIYASYMKDIRPSTCPVTTPAVSHVQTMNGSKIFNI